MRSLKTCAGYSLILFALAFVAACSSSSSSDTPASAATTSIGGTVFASPVSGASVIVKDANGNTVAGPVNTAGDGTYSISIPTSVLASDLRIESGSGTFTDEATRVSTAAGTLAAYVSGGTLTAGSVNLDPSSTVVHSLVTKYGKSAADANTYFNTAFGYSPDTSIKPKNAPVSGSDDTAQRLAGLRAGAFSQLTKDLGLTPDRQFDLLEALAHDLADGSLNGKDGSTLVSIGTSTTMPEDIENRFENALVSFLSNTACNATGLTTADIGSLPFGKVALTDTYRVEYVSGMKAAAQGKTTFTLKISDRTTGLGVSGLTVALMPMMHMATDQHATPVDTVVDKGSGTYACTVYYLMSSRMSGTSVGYWELQVMIGMDETATFYPSVGMAMGSDTVRATLKGQNDVISSMTGTEKRSYYLFNDGLTSGMSTTFNLLIAAKESMMSYPAVSIGTVLSSPTGTVTSMTVQASSDGGSTWVPATDNTMGHWSMSGLTGLMSSSTGTIYIKMNINGEDKTTNGNAVSGSNAYATFTVAPGSGM